MRTHVDEEGVDLLLPAFYKLVTVVLDNNGGLIPGPFFFLQREVIPTLVPAVLHGFMCDPDKQKQTTSHTCADGIYQLRGSSSGHFSSSFNAELLQNQRVSYEL